MKELFQQVQNIGKQDECTISEAVCKLTEEVGELAQAVNMSTGRKKTSFKSEEIKEHITEESADVIQNVFYVIQKFGITYEELIAKFESKNKEWETVVTKRNLSKKTKIK